MFQLIKKSKFGRIAKITTPHGIIETPVFMPPATKGYIKSLDSQDLENLGLNIILVNALHLHFKPGERLIKKMGGIHKFMNWKKAILSDSGGFQAWSFQRKEKNYSKVNNQGIYFISPYDGSTSFVSPEKSIDIQLKLKVDILMAFDECSPDTLDKRKIEESLERTHQWALRSFSCFQKSISSKKKRPLLFGIVQGGPFKDLRIKSLKFINDIDFDGIALGGETIGFNFPKTLKILKWLSPYIDQKRPLYTMGAGGYPQNVLDLISNNVDMFDCVNPTRLARHGALFTGKIVYKNKQLKFVSNYKNGILKINQSKFKNDLNKIDKNCDCFTCQNYTRAYLRYLYLQKEPLFARLASIHNLRFMVKLIEEIKSYIYGS